MSASTTRSKLAVNVTVLFVAALVIGACGGTKDDGIATGDPSATKGAATGSAPAANNQERLRQYVTCLREHGVEVADPEAGKQVQLNNDRPQDKEAAQACRQYLPTAAKGGSTDSNSMREYAACMRQHGLPGFPDPDPDHGLQIPKSLMSDPAYEAADRECGEGVKPGAGGK
jgi:hypothetical protein